MSGVTSGSGGTVVGGSGDETSHDRGRKKAKADDFCLSSQSPEHVWQPPSGASYMETLLAAKFQNCPKDSRGSGVFTEAWNEYLDSLKGYFGEKENDQNNGDSNNIDEDSNEGSLIAFDFK